MQSGRQPGSGRRWLAAAVLGSTVLGVGLACAGAGSGGAKGSAAQGSPTAAAEPWAEVIDGIEVEPAAGRLGWRGLHLEMSRRQAERALGTALAVEELEAPVCGTHFAEVAHGGRTLTLQLGGGGPAARVESLHLSLPAPRTPVVELKQAVKTRLPELRYRPSAYEPDLSEGRDSTPLYVLASQPDQALLLKPEEGLYLALAGCLD